MGTICALVHTRGETVPPSAYELLAGARALAEPLGAEVAAAAVGAGARACAGQLAAGGAARVVVVDAPELKDYEAERYLAADVAAVQAAGAGVVLLLADVAGREIGPRLAHRLDGSVATDAVALEADPALGGAVVTRPVYGGKALAKVAGTKLPQVITVKPRALDPVTPEPGAAAEVVEVRVELPAEVPTRVVDTVREAGEGPKIETARVVISGGRGLGGPEPFQLLERLASLLGAAVGASRAAVDEGWVPPTWQIGQTGKSVSCDLYIAVGISGASQHMAGLGGAKTIVAVNTDPEAPIFERATLGVVADYKEFIPAFTEALARVLGK